MSPASGVEIRGVEPLGVAGRRKRTEVQRAVGPADEHPVGDDGVKVGMEVERGAEALHGGDGGALAVAMPAGAGAAAQQREHAADEDPEHARQDRGLDEHARAHGTRDRERPLAVRGDRQDVVAKARGGIDHAAALAQGHRPRPLLGRADATRQGRSDGSTDEMTV
jgi:hypothetical protein